MKKLLAVVACLMLATGCASPLAPDDCPPENPDCEYVIDPGG